MADLVNGQFSTKPISKTITDSAAAGRTRTVTYRYAAPVNQNDFNNGVLTGTNPNQTAIEVYATTGTGRAAQSLGKVGTVNVGADGNKEFIPSGRFNELPEAVRNDISSKNGQEAAKNAINNAATDAKLQNNLTTKAGAAPGAAAPAAGAGGAGGAGAAAPGAAPASEFKAPGSGFGAETASSGGGTYPLRMKDKQDRIIFKSEKGGMVTIGIQPTIQDSNRQNWGESTLGPIEKAALNAAKDLIGAKNYGEELGKQITGIKKAFDEASQDSLSRSAASLYLQAQAVGVEANDLLARSDVGLGVIFNPNLELVYKGPTLRTFSYTFRMTPREPDEAKVIRNIINFFKSNMVPRASDMFFRRPYYFDIIYKGTGAKSLNLIKERCALQDCSVNYTPDGSYMTYQDGSMTSFQVTLQFSETAPLTDKDYEGVNDEQIFY